VKEDPGLEVGHAEPTWARPIFAQVASGALPWLTVSDRGNSRCMARSWHLRSGSC